MKRWQKWTVGVAAVFVVLALAIRFFDWNLAKPYIARKVTAATGRTFAIDGDLDVRLPLASLFSLTPRISADRVELGNAPWSRDPNMIEAKRIEFAIRLLPLLARKVDLPDVVLSEPRVVLERNEQGAANWDFEGSSKDKPADTNKPVSFPTIGGIAIDSGALAFRDPQLKTDLSLNVNTVSASDGRTVKVEGKGTFKGLPSSIVARGGELLALRDASKPYPIDAQATIGATKARAKGTLVDPLHLAGQDVDFALEGNDLAQLYPIIGVPIPPTPPYSIAGRLAHTGNMWSLTGLKGRVGSSDLSGDFSVDRGQTPQFIKADLVSNRLDMKDLGGFIGADRGENPPVRPPPPDRVLPNDPYNLEKVNATNADVKFRGAHIVTDKLPLEDMDVHLVVKDGVVQLTPLIFSTAGGKLQSNITMNAKAAPISTQAEVIVRGLHLDQLMPTGKLASVASGTMGGRAKLAMKGNSIAAMLGSADGEAALIMDGGSISELVMRLTNIDVANAFARLVGGDRETPIRCFVSNWNASNGDFAIQSMVLDTPKVALIGSGHVNLKDETLGLRITAQGKTFSLASFRGPIDIGGTFKHPALRPELGRLAVRGGIAVALGTATAGIGALLPLIEVGKREPTNCQALKVEAKQDVGVKQSDIAPRAPRSGKR